MIDNSFWQSFHDWEKDAAEAWANLIRSPEFVGHMNRQLENWLLVKQQINQAMEDTARAALLPTRAEQDKILYLVRKLESQVEELEARVDKLNASLSTKVE